MRKLNAFMVVVGVTLGVILATFILNTASYNAITTSSKSLIKHFTSQQEAAAAKGPQVPVPENLDNSKFQYISPSKDSPIKDPNHDYPSDRHSPNLTPVPPPYGPFPTLKPSLVGAKSMPVDVRKDLPVDLTLEDGTKMKVILYWNEAYSNKHFGFGFGRLPFQLAGCPEDRCVATGDRNRYPPEQVDALLWHFRSQDKSLPKHRDPHTRYIFWMMESASYLYGDLSKYNNVFNWTFTYRRDADLYNPYWRLFRRPNPLPPSTKNMAAGKTKMAAWFVSNCVTKSGREKVVNELKRWINVDVYGHCGSLRCERSEHGKCMKMLESDYKFYLSFENSLCQDYVTEKFYNGLSVNVVPVVYGKGNYSAIAPPHSYIDALSFPSVNKLAEYLVYLDNNDTAYNEYFRWKSYYEPRIDWAVKAMPFCELCAKLHTDTTTKTYDMRRWFEIESRCQTFGTPAINNYINGGDSQVAKETDRDHTWKGHIIP